MRIVVDTNVLVSAILSPHAPPARVLHLVLQGTLVPLYDHRILSEYREVLSRPLFAFGRQDVEAVMNGLEWVGEMVFAKPMGLELADPDDVPFMEVAIAGRANALVTGNACHFRTVRGRHVNVITPRELLDALDL